jgi:hypothetical protein
MAQNPLQQYFRQPKIFINLPSHGVFNKPGFVNGDIDRIPVFGMTGMDEILVKTPDALLTGESTVKVISSCCPAITEPWNLSIIDLDIILTAIRIATYGSTLDITQVCDKCGTENEYDFDLSTFVDYYASCSFSNKVIVGDLTIYLKPLSYKQSSEFSLRNFQMQQQLKHVDELTDEDEKKKQLSALYETLATLQNEILVEGIESVEVSTTKVTERGYIKEWVENCDSSLLVAIKSKIQENQKSWRSPNQTVVCDNCGHSTYLSISLDQSDFFAAA